MGDEADRIENARRRQSWSRGLRTPDIYSRAARAKTGSELKKSRPPFWPSWLRDKVSRYAGMNWRTMGGIVNPKE